MKLQYWFKQNHDKFILENKKYKNTLFSAKYILPGEKEPMKLDSPNEILETPIWRTRDFLKKSMIVNADDCSSAYHFCCHIFQKIFKIYRALNKNH